MPWQSEAMKGVITCDKPRLGSNNLLSLGFLNGETHLQVKIVYNRAPYLFQYAMVWVIYFLNFFRKPFLRKKKLMNGKVLLKK